MLTPNAPSLATSTLGYVRAPQIVVAPDPRIEARNNQVLHPRLHQLEDLPVVDRHDRRVFVDNRLLDFVVQGQLLLRVRLRFGLGYEVVDLLLVEVVLIVAAADAEVLVEPVVGERPVRTPTAQHEAELRLRKA